MNALTCDSGCRALGASANTVAVALDGTNNDARQGVVQLYSLPEFKFICAVEENKFGQVDILRFSPDGNTFVAILL